MKSSLHDKSIVHPVEDNLLCRFVQVSYFFFCPCIEERTSIEA